jgi:hypothetical protein
MQSIVFFKQDLQQAHLPGFWVCPKDFLVLVAWKPQFGVLLLLFILSHRIGVSLKIFNFNLIGKLRILILNIFKFHKLL